MSWDTTINTKRQISKSLNVYLKGDGSRQSETVGDWAPKSISYICNLVLHVPSEAMQDESS